jgi:DnaJ family protein A protein 2
MPGANLYELLGVARDAEINEIRKAFKKQAMIHHPDKGGDPEKFKEIQHAHDVLTDERRRQVYDMTGSDEEGAGGMPGGFSGMPFDIGSIFSGMADLGSMGIGGMFGGMGGGGVRRAAVRRPKAPPKIHEIPLKLSDYYKGRQIQVRFERQTFCSACKGQGATSFQSCSPCQGRGVIRQMMQMGPLQMINEGPCRECSGAGKLASGNCYKCSGKKTLPEEKVLDVKIEPGMKPGEVLIFPKVCSDDPHFDEPGDVHLVLQEAEGDNGWTRKGDDLHTTAGITYTESILGSKIKLEGHPGFPDGLEMPIPCGVVNREVMCVKEKGMTRRNGGYGDLYVEIQFKATDDEKNILQRNQPLLSAMFQSTGS